MKRAVAIALALRVIVALVAAHWTPNDVLHHFRLTGEYVRAGRDPITLPRHEWNFLPLMAYVHALEQLLGLPWRYAVKIVPILADCVSVVLIGRLAGERRAFEYAVNPVALLVVSVHGQVEPVVLCLCLAALLTSELRAGLLVGAAIAAKTWPVLVLLALLRRRSWRLLAGAVVVPLLTFGSGLLFLDTRLGTTVHGLVSYTSYVGRWTWSGIAVARGARGGFDTPLGVAGALLTALAVIAALWWFRAARPALRIAAVLAAVVVVTSGFGVQYLLWPVPFLVVAGTRRRWWYFGTAAAWAALFYFDLASDTWLAALSFVVAATLAVVVLQARDTAPGGPLPSSV